MYRFQEFDVHVTLLVLLRRIAFIPTTGTTTRGKVLRPLAIEGLKAQSMAWFKNASVPYIPLKSSGTDALEELEELLAHELHRETESPKSNKAKTFASFTVLAVVLSIANLLFCVDQLKSSGPTRFSSTVYGSGVEFASSYINIGLASGEMAQNYTLDNMPLVVGTVDRERPNFARPDETPHWKTNEGVVIPDRRHILVNETVSTIAQFRVLEFGLEICQPTIILPTFTTLRDANSTVRCENNKPRTYQISRASPVSIHAWLLETLSPEGVELELNLARLTFAGLPPRQKYLGTISAQEGKSATANSFACKSASLHTVELSCDNPGCLVDFWSDDVEPRMAFVIHQSSIAA